MVVAAQKAERRAPDERPIGRSIGTGDTGNNNNNGPAEGTIERERNANKRPTMAVGRRPPCAPARIVATVSLVSEKRWREKRRSPVSIRRLRLAASSASVSFGATRSAGRRPSPPGLSRELSARIGARARTQRRSPPPPPPFTCHTAQGAPACSRLSVVGAGKCEPCSPVSGSHSSA